MNLTQRLITRCLVIAFGLMITTVVAAQDATKPMSADDVVRLALARNGELTAMRREADAARAMVRQAGLRANPSVEARRAQDIRGMDSQLMIEGMIPLELGGRRSARIRVAEAEATVRELAADNSERLLAAEVRIKFAETVAARRRLAILERIIVNAEENYRLVAARVMEGKIAPLEQNMLLVELNRLRSLRETAAGKFETLQFELRNVIGLRPDEALPVAADFGASDPAFPAEAEAFRQALATRPDLNGVRAQANVAVAKIESAKAGARPDASLKSGYQRMRNGFPQTGFDSAGMPAPIENTVNMFTFGFEIELPVRNRNQGELEAASFERDAAVSRINFGELTVRREVAVAYARYARAVRARSIFETGVLDQAAANLRVVWQTYELGKNALTVYLAEQRRVLEIENEAVDAELESYLAGIEIMRVLNAPELRTK